VKRERLYFSGTRRRATDFVAFYREVVDYLDEQRTVVGNRFAILASDGQGQPYELNRPDSFWRSFSEIDLASGWQGRNFVKRYGCPLGVLGAPGTEKPEYVLSLWLPVQSPLRAAAQVWLPKDADSHSRCETTRNELAARTLIQDTPREVWDETRLAPPADTDDPAEPQPRALTLRAFMVLSALYDLRNANTMRECSFCRSWFTVRRTGALFCSQSCNVSSLKLGALIQARKGTASHGDDSQDQDQGRNDNPSSEVVRAGSGGEAPAAHEKLRDRKGSKVVRRAPDNRGRAKGRRRPAKT
jgi:hypothetical protein